MSFQGKSYFYFGKLLGFQTRSRFGLSTSRFWLGSAHDVGASPHPKFDFDAREDEACCNKHSPVASSLRMTHRGTISMSTNIMEPSGWRAAVPLPNLAVCTAKNATSYPDDILLQKSVTFSGENLGWRAPAVRLNLAVCTAKTSTSHPDDMILYHN